MSNRLLAPVVTLALLAAALVGGLLVDPLNGGPEPVLAAADAPLLRGRVPTQVGGGVSMAAPTTAAPPATAALPALPQPVSPPDDPYHPEPVRQLGTIEIPAIGLSTVLMEGVTLHNIDEGPSHWPGTALPGDLGNVVVAGHRTTHSRPFHDIDRLTAGDEVVFTVDGRRSVYVVERTEIVTPDALHIVTQWADHTGTLFACHPKGSAAQRFVVHLRLVDPPAVPAA